MKTEDRRQTEERSQTETVGGRATAQAIIDLILSQNKYFTLHSSPYELRDGAPTGGLTSSTGPSRPLPRGHFPDILVDSLGTIVLCPGCSGSDASKDGDYFICRACGSVWRKK